MKKGAPKQERVGKTTGIPANRMKQKARVVTPDQQCAPVNPAATTTTEDDEQPNTGLAQDPISRPPISRPNKTILA